LTIVVYQGDVALPKEKVLRRGKTDRDGKYALSIDLRPYPHGVNVRIAVLDRQRRQIWSSPIHFNAKPDLKINAQISDRVLGITEFSRLAGKVEARTSLARLWRLNPTQRTYLAGSVGATDADIGLLTAASRLHAELPAVSIDVLYGVLTQGTPRTLDSLAALPEARWRGALAAAAANNVIAALSPNRVSKVVAALNARKGRGAKGAPVVPVAGPAAFVGAAVAGEAKQGHVVALVEGHGGVNEAFWKAVEHSRSVTAKDLAALRSYVQVDRLLGKNPELLKGVAGYLRDRGSGVSPAALATIKASAWTGLVEDAARKSRERAPNGNGAATARAVVRQTAGNLAGKVVFDNPTPVLAAEIGGARATGYFGAYKKELSAFFQRNSEVDIRKELSGVLGSDGAAAFRGIGEKGPVKERLKTLARLYRALPEAHAPAVGEAALDSPGLFARVSALADAEGQYRSSFDISRRPRAAFVKELGGRDAASKDYWGRVHDQATAMSDVAHFSAVSLLQQARMGTNVTRGLLPGPGEEVVPRQPGTADIRSLFGPLESCDCEECTSITGPGAYLADLLNFLKTEVAVSEDSSPYEVLVKRRPDIPHLLLNCDNANVELPYIDVVNELLEDEVLRQRGLPRVWAPYHDVTVTLSPAWLDLAALQDPQQTSLATNAIATALNAALDPSPPPSHKPPQPLHPPAPTVPVYDFDADLQVSVKHFRDDGTGDSWFVFNKGWLVELSYDGPSMKPANGSAQPANRSVLGDRSVLGNRSLQLANRSVRAANRKSAGRGNVTNPQAQGGGGRGRTYALSVDYVSRQTYGTAEELEANPLFRSDRAAQILEGTAIPNPNIVASVLQPQGFPPSRPPGLPLLETRLFLQHLKLPREQLIRQLQAAKVDVWAVEYLGLSAADVDQLGLAGGYASWGFAGAYVTANDLVADPVDSTRLVTGHWSQKVLRRVDVLIARARISYIDLLELLDSGSVNPVVNGARAIVAVDPNDPDAALDPATCDISKLRIFPGGEDFETLLERIRRFLRLQRRVQWKTWELDLALRQLAPDLLDPHAPHVPGVATKLIPLAILQRVKVLLRLGHADACALLGAIDLARRLDYRADGQPLLASQYETLFLNRAITNPVDPRFRLDQNRVALAAPPAVADSQTTLAAGFQVDVSDISLILGRIGVAPTTPLSLDLISRIYKRVLFARGLGLSVQELIWIEILNGGLPTIDECLDFIERVTLLERSPMSVTEVWFLLAPKDPLTDYLVPADDEIAQQLDDLRQQLAKIDADHVASGAPDTDGSRLRAILGELDFGGPLTDELIGAVTDTQLFTVDATLPQGAVDQLDPAAGVAFSVAQGRTFPDDFVTPAVADGLVRYQDGALVAVHPLTRSDRLDLLAAAKTAPFATAVEKLYGFGRLSYQKAVGTLAATLTCRGLLPDATVAVIAPPPPAPQSAFAVAVGELVDQQKKLLELKLSYAGLREYDYALPTATANPAAIPAELQPYVYVDAVRNVLVVRGLLTPAEIARLQVIAGLPALAGGGQAIPSDIPMFLSVPEVGTMFFGANLDRTTADISKDLLETHHLLADARDLLKRKAIATTLASALGLTNDVAQLLIDKLKLQTDPTTTLADALLKLSIPGPPLDLAPYESEYRRLNKIALLLQRLTIRDLQLPWVLDDDYGAADWLRLPNLRDGASPGTDLDNLTELVRLIGISNQAPYSPQLVDQTLADAAHVGTGNPASVLSTILARFAASSPWLLGDLTLISSSLGITGAQGFLMARSFERLRDAMSDLMRLGATAIQGLQLAAYRIEAGAAILAKSLAKSKHPPDDWLTVVGPINDILREARRVVLVDYLVTHPRRDSGTGAPLWHDVDTLYEYLLVDVQMSACMKTTRIRLALNSVQLFVQRCLLNLEDDVIIGDDPLIRLHWDEFDSWRRLFRIWEANRDILIHPEEWMDPTLRDDKSPQFEMLENELQQADVTNDAAEAAVLNYLQRLDQISKLEVMGIYIEYGPFYVDPESQKRQARRVLHVVARTYGQPYQWFYRTLTSTWPNEWHEGVWSPWQTIDTDIEGEHVLPVVWNGRLYLFWALFEVKGERPPSNQLNDKKTHDSREHWYIRFAWSELRNGAWTPKRLSADSMQTAATQTSDRTFTEDDFSFKTEVTPDHVTIKCYGPVVTGVDDAGDTTTDPTSTDVNFLPGPTPPSPVMPSQVSIDFVDPTTSHWRDDIDITVYQAFPDAQPPQPPRELFTLMARDVQGRFDLWSHFGWSPVPDWWKQMSIQVSTRPNVQLFPYSQQQPDSPLVTPRDNGLELTYTAIPVTNTPVLDPGSSGSSGDTPTNLPPVTVTWSKIGHFDLQICGGDLIPTARVEPETIPALDDNVRLRGMMYVEKEDPIVTDAPSQPFLNYLPLLRQTPAGLYRVVVPHQTLDFFAGVPFFFQTDREVFMVVDTKQFRFDVCYHPYICDFLTIATQDGIPKLFTLKSQLMDDGGQTFRTNYDPDQTNVQLTETDADMQSVDVTREYVDFSPSGAYSSYNWELFFHAPWLVATRLKTNMRFEEARKWFHYVFDPTARPGADTPLQEQQPTQRFWNFLPFWRIEGQKTDSIDDLLRGTANSTELFRQWREKRFDPFLIGRLRPTAFARAFVLDYIDNLVAWGDQQFAQFTAESTNEATLLYVLASQILGPAPERVPPRARPTLQTYDSLASRVSAGDSPVTTWQDFSDVLVEIETFIPPSAAIAEPQTSSPLGRTWAFCVPPNNRLLQSWPRIAQRLFNLRHCRDIEGVERSFPIWDPPIDPGLLVRAAAAGVDIASVLGDINAARPHYRFSVMVQRAIDLCNEVKAFGAALLSALQNTDAEGLALLRAGQDVALADKVRDVRKVQIQQSTAQREAAERSRIIAEARLNHYQSLQFRNAGEVFAQTISGVAITNEAAAAVAEGLGAVVSLVPQFSFGTSGTYGSPVSVTAAGGELLSRAASATAGLARATASTLSMLASGALTQAGFDRRDEEWALQKTVAQREMDQIDKQISAAQLQESIAQLELDSQETQLQNAKDVESFLKSKYTNKELYAWYQGQHAGLYFQAYKLAFDVAKKAERAYCYELGTDATFIQFGYWDSLKKGLLAGERLQSDLRRMEAAYLDQNVRELEIIKHVSLALLDPTALLLLKATGECEVDLPEALFDMDYRGHYLRRIKTVALSIPCVTGPYISVNCTLTQLRSKVRLPPDGAGADYDDPANFHEYFGGPEAIVTSAAREDAGLFEVNLRDERYLPFEGTGAISRWRIELPLETNRFDIRTVSDVVLHFRYTARDGGEGLRDAVPAQFPLTDMRMFSLKYEFPSEWAQLTSAAGAALSASSTISLSKNRFPFFATSNDKAAKINRVSIFALPPDGTGDLPFPTSLHLDVPGAASVLTNGATDTSIGTLSGKTFKRSLAVDDNDKWTFTVDGPAAFKQTVDDVVIICQYQVTSP
jgi:hypothetical protein